MKKLAIGCASVFAIVSITISVLVFWLVRELPVLDASLSAPSMAELDSTVTVIVTASNSHTKAIVLDSMDIGDSFLSGFQVVSVQPKPTDTMRIWGMRSWDFGKSVAPGESVKIQFRLKAIQEGHFSGDIDVCNPNQDSTTLIADIVVRKEVSNNLVENIASDASNPHQ